MLRKTAWKLFHTASNRSFKTLNSIGLSRDNLLHNFDLVQSQHPDMQIMPVLKANAYGHGIQQIAEMLNGATCGYVVVDGYFEAAKIQHITNHRILVLGYIAPENFKLLNTKKCTFVVQDIASLRAWQALGRPITIHLELNTGMNRLGLDKTELAEYLTVLRQSNNLRLDGVMTHLADADNGDSNAFTARQANEFGSRVQQIFDAGFTPKYIHIVQTAGSTKANSKYANAIRLGIGLYGINPLSQGDAHYSQLSNLKPVLQLTSTVIKTIDLEPGDKVSYNGIFTALKPMRIAVLPLGYYEGVPRELSNKGTVMFGDVPLPIVGRVCMNHMMVDITNVEITVGDTVTVISRDPTQPNSVKQIAQTHNLFSYGLVTKLSSSIRRVID